MSGENDYVPPFRLSTDELPEKDRLPVWIEKFGRTLFKIDIEPLPDAPFFQSATFRKLPGLSMTVGEGSGGRATRTRRHIANSANDSMFHIHLGGNGRFSQLGRETVFGPGEAVLASGEDVTDVLYPGAFRYITICVPREALLNRGPDRGASFMRLIPRSSEALRLLTGYLSIFDSAGVQLTPDAGSLGSAFVTHVHDLCALALKPTRDTFDQAQGGLKAARLHAIKRDILAHLGDAGLTLSAEAARQGVSPRYVGMLFEPEGITFSGFLLSERLALAHRMLSDPRFDGHAVAQIGYEAGFADLSYFNRCFRKRYGQTPSDVRAAARREREGK